MMPYGLVPLCAGSLTVGITAAPDGNLWFAERGGNKIGRIAPPSLACTIQANAPVGTSIPFQVTLYDGLAGAGNKLASNMVTSNITVAGPNNVALVLGGVVDHIDVGLGLSQITPGAANSVPAAVFSISPTQVNFIVPSNLASGSATVVVANGGTSATTFTGTSTAQASPSFFVYGAASPYYVSAYHANYTLVGDPAAQPGSTKAHPGEEIFLYATGLAPAPGGTVIAASEFSQTSVTVTAGSIPLTVAAGSDGKLAPYLIEAGLFQINVILPTTIAAGNYNLTMTVPNGTTASSGISVILPVGP